MRNSRRLPWLIFAVCALLVVDGLGWVTWQMLSLERREHEAQQRASRQEAVRLALWRMDGLLSPLIATEAARPYFHYRAFYPAERPYGRMWEPVEPGEPVAASPLLAGAGDFIRLHFEGSPDGWITSPQAPEGPSREPALDIAPTQLQEAERELLELTALLRGTPPPAALEGLRDAREAERPAADPIAARQLRQLAEREEEYPEVDAWPLGRGASPDSAVASDDAGRSVADYQARQRASQSARNVQSFAEPPQAKAGQPAGEERLASEAAEPSAPVPDVEQVRTGPFRPIWLARPSGEPELLFIRSVRIGAAETVQGFWVDWPGLRRALLATSQDLLPGAELLPLLSEAGATPVSRSLGAAERGRLLAGVPALLVPRVIDADAIYGLTATRTVLIIAWLAVVAAVVAIGLVLRASLSLSERRGRFVSAVTHELRTPLTTFCLYSQMLADGMVPDEQRRKEYLGTLRREAERLAGIVENVLAYARAGTRRRAEAPPEPIANLLAHLAPSLRERAQQAGMELEIDSAEAEGLYVAADRDSVERILANLVDNACTYAAEAADRRVSVSVRPASGGVEFRVRDRGPGVARRERRRIFRPFVQAREGGGGSRGLGLGLALALGVARSLGGDLRLARGTTPGAEFVLWLPRAIPPAGAG